MFTLLKQKSATENPGSLTCQRPPEKPWAGCPANVRDVFVFTFRKA